MAVYRCAACGSSHVVVDKKKEGYSKKKGFLGTLLFGSGGAVAGVNGETVTYYHCSECGQVLSYPMSETQKMVIDYALEHKQMSRYIEELNNLKKQYSGIEWNDSDSRNAQKMLNSKAERITDKIVTECIEFIMQKSSTSHDELVVFLTDLGYGETIIRNIKTALADKDDIHVKFVMQDNKLFYELCYDKTVDGTRPLAHWNKMILRKCDASEIQRKRKEEDARFKSQYSKLESAIISELSKYDEPVIINKLYRNNTLASCSKVTLLKTVSGLEEKQIVKKTQINGIIHVKLLNK